MDSSFSSRTSSPAAAEWFTPVRFAAIMALLLLGAFPEVLLGLHSFVYRDYGVLAYPFIHYARDSFWRGELPLWNPLSNCGAPFLAQWGTMTLYPLSLVYLLFPLPWSLGVFCLGHLFLGGTGMYFLARRWTNSGFAASIAGVAFVFNGVTLSCLMWPNYTVALGWMPWVIGFAERAWAEGGRRLAQTALVGALQLLAGVPEIAGFTWLVAGGLWLGCWITEGAGWKTMTGRLGTVVMLAAGLSAIQLLPFVDLLEHSQRDRAFATNKWALPGWGWANLLVPLFHCFQTYQGPFVQNGQAFFSSCYLGAGLVGLGWIGFWREGRWRARLLGVVALFGLIAALGDHGHLYAWIRKCVPLLGVGRYPVKFMVLPAFALPLLAAFALAWWKEESNGWWQSSQKWFWITGTILLAGMGAILWFAFRYPFPLDQWPATWHNAVWRGLFLAAIMGGVASLPRLERGISSTVVELAILALLVVDVIAHTPSFNPTIAAAEFQPGLWQRQRQTPPPGLGKSRVMISPRAEKILLVSTETNLARDFLAKRLALWSNLNLLDGAAKVNGSSTLQVREEKQVESLLYDGPGREPGGLMDFLAVAEATSRTSAIEWTTRSNPCPMVTCGQQPVFASATNILEALAAPDFDPRTMVYLPLEAKSVVTVNNRTDAKVRDSRFSAHRVAIEVEAKAPALVVVAQTFYHSWRASVDGRPVPLLRANHAFQAVEVPAGRSRVVLRYQDRSFFAGAIVSAVSALVSVVVWRRRGKSVESGHLLEPISR